MASKEDLDEHTLFTAVIEAISNDRFLRFMEQFTHALIAPTSPKYLAWCDEAKLHLNPTDERGGALTSSSTSILSYSMAHFNAFGTYQLMFESRITSILRKIDPCLTSERFFELCSTIIGGDRDVRPPSGCEGAGDAPASVEDLCRALLDMVDSVASFEHFCAMLSERQRNLLHDDDVEESESD